MQKASIGAIYLLKRTELAVRSCVEAALAEFDLTPTQFLMLLRLRDTDGLSAASLAREIAVRPQSVVEILAPLERKGLIKRKASAEHRRILEIRLATAGRRLLDEAVPTTAKLEAELLQDLNARQLDVLQQALGKLWARAEKHELHPSSIRRKATQELRNKLAARQRRGVRAGKSPAVSQ